jgi:hypothetical protein
MPPRWTDRSAYRNVAFFAAAAAAVGAAAAIAGPDAAAAVSQPTGEMMPNPAPASEIGIATARGFAADTVSLAGLFKYRMETLNPIQDANTMPGTFSPKCEFSGQLVLRGGGCHVAFGWYNVTPGSTTPPAPTEIYELVPAQLPRCPAPPMLIPATLACCDDTEFCPLADMLTTQAPQHRWNVPPFTARNIRTDPHYKGGLIGFAMIGSTTEQCSQTKFSQAELNTKSANVPPTNGAPWVTTLIYQSSQDPNGYYIAFEDLPVTTASWKGNGNDGDFNDFVYYVHGLNCEGGGKACDTMMPGVCATGTTQCTNGTVVVCKPDLAAKPEVCDGLDNDCDGVVDQGNPCTGLNQICDRGVCIQKCNDSEFPCAPGLQCADGYCRDPQCLGMDCPAGEICTAGKCQGGCDGVVCPQGQLCRLGRCVDPCADVKCDDGICDNGACVPSCPCRTCGGGTLCKESEGRCVDPGCEKMDCGPGKVCIKGLCSDPCYGATRCPAGQACSMGACKDVPRTGTGGFVGTTRFDAGTLGGLYGGTGTGGSPGAGATGPGLGGAPGAVAGDGIKRCGCDVGGSSAGLLSLLSLVVAAGIISRRRARS